MKELQKTLQIIPRMTAPVTPRMSYTLCSQSWFVTMARKRPGLVSCDLVPTHDTVFETDVPV